MDYDDYPDGRSRRERTRPPGYMNDDERVRRPSYYKHGVDYSASESDEDIRIIPRGRRAFTSAFSRDRSQSLNERRYTARSRYSPQSRSRLHVRGRSPSPLRHRWDYEEPAPPIPVHVNSGRTIPVHINSARTIPGHINSSRTHLHKSFLEYVPPIDKDGNPLNLDVNLVSSAKDEKSPGWTNRRTEFASQRPESLSLEASRGFADDTETEKIILTVNSESNPDKAESLRWM